jgi:hypothetical protein
LKHKFRSHLGQQYAIRGNSAKGIDVPDLDVDLKVTSGGRAPLPTPGHSEVSPGRRLHVDGVWRL